MLNAGQTPDFFWRRPPLFLKALVPMPDSLILPTPRSVDPRVLEILVCPVTKTPLRYDAAQQELISDRAHLAFPIREGIPILLVDEARKIED